MMADTSHINSARLFRFSHVSGSFKATEIGNHFSMLDLFESTDSVMMLDSGNKIYLHVGGTSSDITKKLSVKATQIYIKHLDDGRTVKTHVEIVRSRREPYDFKKCFIEWMAAP